jgi:hypothetical protein
MWPLIQAHIPDAEYRAAFVRDLLRCFLDCDVEAADLHGIHTEVDRALEGLGERQG